MIRYQEKNTNVFFRNVERHLMIYKDCFTTRKFIQITSHLGVLIVIKDLLVKLISEVTQKSILLIDLIDAPSKIAIKVILNLIQIIKNLQK